MSNESFTKGFIKRAQEYGIPEYKAQRLFKEADLEDFGRDNVFRHAGAALTRNFNGSFNPLNWTHFSGNTHAYHDSQQEAYGDLAGKYVNQHDAALTNGKVDPAMAAQNTALDYTKQLDNPDEMEGFGNMIVNRNNSYQNWMDNQHQQAQDVATSRANINAYQGRPNVDPIPTSYTPNNNQHAGFKLPTGVPQAFNGGQAQPSMPTPTPMPKPMAPKPMTPAPIPGMRPIIN